VAQNILLINGPNLNLLGKREPAVYGSATLGDIEAELAQLARSGSAGFAAFQSNHEGELIDRIHAAAGEGVDFIIINAGALTHSSIGLRDALAGVAIDYVEVHISNVYRREAFRHASLLADRAVGCLIGLGTAGYRLAMQYALERPAA
jgi:3-dehydroquinate dehydratase-2